MFMGFQYLCVSGWPATMPPPTIDSVRGYPTSTLSKRHQVGELIFDGVTPSANIANNWAAQPPPPPPPPGLHTKLNAEILAGVFHLIIWGQVRPIVLFQTCNTVFLNDTVSTNCLNRVIWSFLMILSLTN